VIFRGRKLTGQNIFGNAEAAISMFVYLCFQLTTDHSVGLRCHKSFPRTLPLCAAQLLVKVVAAVLMDMSLPFRKPTPELPTVAALSMAVILFHCTKEACVITLLCVAMLLSCLGTTQHSFEAILLVGMTFFHGAAQDLLVAVAAVLVNVNFILSYGAGQFPSYKGVTIISVGMRLSGNRCITRIRMDMGYSLRHLANQIALSIKAMLLMDMSKIGGLPTD
jgi:hypothetical protein